MATAQSTSPLGPSATINYGIPDTSQGATFNLNPSIGQYLLGFGAYGSTSYTARIFNDGGTQFWQELPPPPSTKSSGILGDVPGWVADILGFLVIFA